MTIAMAAQALMKPSLLKRNGNALKAPSLLRPNLYSLRMNSQQNVMQMKSRISFSVRASDEQPGRKIEKKRELFPGYAPKLTQPKPKPDVNPLIVIAGIAILFFTWKAIVKELLYWLGLAAHALRPVLALVFACLETAAEVLGSLVDAAADAAAPLAAAVMTGTAWAFLIVKEVYAFIIDMTPVRALIEALILASAVLGIGEATKTDAVSSQPYTIGMAGLFGLGAVLGFFPPLIFVFFLFVLVVFSSLVMKRDAVSSVMPVAAVLAAVAEPWVRGIALASFLTLAIYQNWKSPEKEQAALDSRTSYQGPPTLMYMLSLMVGISTAARWLYFRHLLWFAK